MEWTALVERVGMAVEAAGIAVIVLGALLATGRFLGHLRRTEVPDPYTHYRRDIGRAILLGLEILIAADIIRTVVIHPTFRSVGVLAIIVLIRTFLSWSLQLEIHGRWPWQQPEPAPGPSARPPAAGGDRRAGDM